MLPISFYGELVQIMDNTFIDRNKIYYVIIFKWEWVLGLKCSFTERQVRANKTHIKVKVTFINLKLENRFYNTRLKQKLNI